MPEEFKIAEVQVGEDITVVRVAGELDAATTPRLVHRCEEIRARGKRMVLNLAGVTFIASNGIGGLLGLVESFKDDGLPVRFAAVSTAVGSVIQLLNLAQFLPIDTTEKAAVAALEG
jgi:anti-sigma B factor antagonist